MDNKITGNESAFPGAPTDNAMLQGLTIRQYYAGLAMAALIANPDLAFWNDPLECAKRADIHATYLITQLNKSPNP